MSVRRLRSKRITTFAVAAAFAVTSAACVRPDKPTVAVNKVEASLVFGVTKPPEQVETPLQSVTTSPLPDLQQAFASFDFPDAPAPDFGGIPLATPPKVECPQAAPDAAPAKIAEATTELPLPIGVSRYKIGGFFTDETGQKPFASSRFERRIVRRYKQISPTMYSFETVQPVIGVFDRFVVATYEVNTAAFQLTPGAGLPAVTAPRVGEPERGISLVRMAEVDRNGIERATFEPSSGLLLLPLPVEPGERFQSVAVDPKSGQTIAHESSVLRRQKVDACGELVDGWLVESERVVSRGSGSAGGDMSAGSGSGKYSLIFATQLGGLPVQERIVIESGCPVGPCDISSTLGQAKPDPLPPGNE